MITGHNTDITYNGVMYHVQTEDKGRTNPVVETLVYRGGEVLDARRFSYEDLIKDDYDEKKIIDLIEQQHRTVISDIRCGKYDPGGGMMDPLVQGIDNKKSLDQVILDYLSSQANLEHLVLELKQQTHFMEGSPCSLHIHTKTGESGNPLKSAKVVVKIISTVKKPLTIYEGKTDKSGMLIVEFVMPEFPDGNAALLVQGFSDIGTDELKIFINKKTKVDSATKTS